MEKEALETKGKPPKRSKKNIDDDTDALSLISEQLDKNWPRWLGRRKRNKRMMMKVACILCH